MHVYATDGATAKLSLCLNALTPFTGMCIPAYISTHLVYPTVFQAVFTLATIVLFTL